MGQQQACGSGVIRGEVVKLDRGFPLVRLEDGRLQRCEHATTIVKNEDIRAVIGDIVDARIPEGHDMGVIERIHDRSSQFIRKDPTERVLPQVLAANFDRVIIAQPVLQVNLRRLERELVLAFETGAAVAVVLTKADLADESDEIIQISAKVRDLAGSKVPVVVMAANDKASIDKVRKLIPPNETVVLIGRSGVGKSTLVNILCGEEVRRTSSVREVDGKGRHTTVSREIVQLPGAGRLVDMPGVRGLGIWEAEEGIGAAFSDIEELSAECRFRDCKHQNEPGCAVIAAVDSGKIPRARFESYQQLRRETAAVSQRRQQARWRKGEPRPKRKK